MADLFCDDVSMFIRELLLAHLLPGKVFNLVALWTEKTTTCMPLNNFCNSDKGVTSKSMKKLSKVKLVDMKLAPGKLCFGMLK